MDARAWIASLPRAVAPQAAVLLRLLDALEADERFRALQLRGSLARGTADELSDIDTQARVDDERYDATLADLPALVRSLGPTADILFETPGSPYLFVQYADGVQLEIAARRASEAPGLGPGIVVLLDRDRLLAEPYEPEPAWDRALWLGWAWMALCQVDKHLRRGSLWEALAALEKGRSLLVRHHAATQGMIDPEYGITSILDYGGTIPEGLDQTLAHLDAGKIRRAALALTEIVARYEQRPLGDLVRQRLETG